MKIYSWNMLFRNQKLDRAFAFIRDSEWDIFCLQEVPEQFLTRLKTLPVEIVAAPEVDREFKKERSTQYIAILSRHPIHTFKPMPLPYHDSDRLLLGKIFTRTMSVLRLWARAVGNRHAIHADIAMPGGSVRVFNLHLPLLNPAIRLNEFETAMLERDPSRPTIVCGDFNILESAHITPLNLFLGGKVSDVVLYSRERTRVEQGFSEYELVNPLRGNSTHPFSRSQLDHILVSKSFSIKNAEVLSDRIGSDHCPIRVEVA